MEYTLKDLKTISAALVVQEKSVIRLAAKEGQPESVAVEYRKVAQEISSVMKKVAADLSEKEGKDKK